MSKAFDDPLAQDDLLKADDPSLWPAPSIPQRLASIDAYRGLVMFLMMAEVLQLRRVARAHGDLASGQLLAITSHTWSGSAARCTT